MNGHLAQQKSGSSSVRLVKGRHNVAQKEIMMSISTVLHDEARVHRPMLWQTHAVSRLRLSADDFRRSL